MKVFGVIIAIFIVYLQLVACDPPATVVECDANSCDVITTEGPTKIVTTLTYDLTNVLATTRKDGNVVYRNVLPPGGIATPCIGTALPGRVVCTNYFIVEPQPSGVYVCMNVLERQLDLIKDVFTQCFLFETSGVVQTPSPDE